ncbi:MAG: hypothetical protein ACHQD8_04475 [Chitinophagales bacterium]
MKKLIPIVLIAVIGFTTFSSCKKKSSASTCTCKTKGVSGQDTTVLISTTTAGYSSLSAECSSADSALKIVLGTGYGCHM